MIIDWLSSCHGISACKNQHILNAGLFIIKTHIVTGCKVCFSPLTFTYSISGLTQRARLLGSVQGVVVQAISATSSFSNNGKLTMTDGSWTSWRTEIEACSRGCGNLYTSSTPSLGTNLVVLVGLKVGQGGVAGSGEGHDFDPAVNQALVVQLLEHPPKQGDGTSEL